MRKWKAKDMVFVQLLNHDSYAPEKRNYSFRSLIYRTPAYQSYGDENGGSDNGVSESISLTVNVEEGIVFLEESSKAYRLLENEKEIILFVEEAQRRFEQEIDMGTRGSHFIFGYGGKMASLREYDNPNIEYIPLIFPDNEKFQNPRYREKVEWSLINEGAIFIVPKNGEKYLAVIQRKNKPRDLKAFSRYIINNETINKPINKTLPEEKQPIVNITVPKWLGDSIGLLIENKETIIKTVIEKQTDKAVLIKYNNKTAWLPKSKISIH